MTSTTLTPLYVECHIGAECYAFSIVYIQEIIKMHPYTTLPGSHPTLRGVINLRGHIIPIYGLREMLRKPAQADTKMTRIVIVQLAGKMLGLVVDGVNRVLRFTETKPVSEGFGHPGIVGLQAIGEHEGSFIGILDVKELFVQGVSEYE